MDTQPTEMPPKPQPTPAINDPQLHTDPPQYATLVPRSTEAIKTPLRVADIIVTCILFTPITIFILFAGFLTYGFGGDIERLEAVICVVILALFIGYSVKRMRARKITFFMPLLFVVTWGALGLLLSSLT